MGGRVVLVLAVLLVAAPFAAAGDPFQEQACVEGAACVGPGTCTLAGCVPRGCEPAASCRGEVGPGVATCAVNMTIQGQTCQTFVGAGASDERPLAIPGYGDASGTGAAAGVQLSNGSVRQHELSNAWVSPSVEARARVLGADLGAFSVGAYRSDILTEGPRGGPLGALTPYDNHTWTEIALFARHAGGPTGGEDVVVGVWLLDLVPDGCWVRSPSGALPELDCPRAHSPLA